MAREQVVKDPRELHDLQASLPAKVSEIYQRWLTPGAQLSLQASSFSLRIGEF